MSNDIKSALQTAVEKAETASTKTVESTGLTVDKSPVPAVKAPKPTRKAVAKVVNKTSALAELDNLSPEIDQLYDKAIGQSTEANKSKIECGAKLFVFRAACKQANVKFPAALERRTHIPYRTAINWLSMYEAASQYCSYDMLAMASAYGLDLGNSNVRLIVSNLKESKQIPNDLTKVKAASQARMVVHTIMGAVGSAKREARQFDENKKQADVVKSIANSYEAIIRHRQRVNEENKDGKYGKKLIIVTFPVWYERIGRLVVNELDKREEDRTKASKLTTAMDAPVSGKQTLPADM